MQIEVTKNYTIKLNLEEKQILERFIAISFEHLGTDNFIFNKDQTNLLTNIYFELMKERKEKDNGFQRKTNKMER